MIKKLLFAAFIMLPASLLAQSRWENNYSRKSAPQPVVEEVTVNPDLPYLKGAVPEVEGRVVFTFDYDLPGKKADEIYNVAYGIIEDLTSDRNQQEGKSRIVSSSREENTICAQLFEYLVFTNKILMLDRTRFSYTLMAKCEDGKLHITAERMHFNYDNQRNSTHMTAEEIITDKVCLKKNGTQLRKYNSKFRRKTVDRMAELQKYFASELR